VSFVTRFRRPQLADTGDCLRIRKVVADIFYSLSSRGQPTRGSPRAWAFDRGLTAPQPNDSMLRNVALVV
jgi:hypothetical protein